MTKKEIKAICENVQRYYIERMCDLCEEGREKDALALHEEIEEWLMQTERPKILTLKVNNNKS
jgi:hypothetical protein